ncbi:MAG: hypothetical protein MHM6MM_005331 [Cercozoa sp. M6MM]
MATTWPSSWPDVPDEDESKKQIAARTEEEKENDCIEVRSITKQLREDIEMRDFLLSQVSQNAAVCVARAIQEDPLIAALLDAREHLRWSKNVRFAQFWLWLHTRHSGHVISAVTNDGHVSGVLMLSQFPRLLSSREWLQSLHMRALWLFGPTRVACLRRLSLAYDEARRKVASYLLTHSDARHVAFIDIACVDPDMRQSELGRRLLQHACDAADRRQAHLVIPVTHDTNDVETCRTSCWLQRHFGFARDDAAQSTPTLQFETGDAGVQRRAALIMLVRAPVENQRE